MSKVASTYNKLGRHSEALVLKEKALEFLQHVLPEDHPDIGDAGVLLFSWLDF